MTQNRKIHDPIPIINQPAPPKIDQNHHGSAVSNNPDDENDDEDQKSSSTVSNVVTTGGGGNETSACAACKYQRRRCAPDCVMAPYFPADRQKQFLNAHKLFGLRNMMKVYKMVKPNEREMSIKNMILEAEVRAHNPVGGCYHIIDRLQKQIQFCKAELGFYLKQLAIYQNLSNYGSSFSSAVASTGSNEANADNVPSIEFKEVGLQSLLFQPESGDEFGVSMTDFYQATYTDIKAVTSYTGVDPTVDESETIQELLISNTSKRIKSDLIKPDSIVPKSKNDGEKNKVPTNRRAMH